MHGADPKWQEQLRARDSTISHLNELVERMKRKLAVPASSALHVVARISYSYPPVAASRTR